MKFKMEKKREKKRRITSSLVLAIYILSVLFSLPVYAVNTEIKVYVNGARVAFPDQKPLINVDSRTLVPARFVSQDLGADVTWDDLAKRVEIRYQSKVITLWIGDSKADVDSREVILDTSPSLVESRTMVPLRFISECLGAKVEWNGSKREVYVTTGDYVDDAALINSDLLLETPAGGQDGVDFIAIIQYKYSTPVAPQLLDLQVLLEKRFPNKAKLVIEYISTKNNTRLITKDWIIDGKLIRVSDSIIYVTVTIWNNGGPK